MNAPQAALRAALAAVLFALISCMDVNEEVWLDANGGGRAEILYSFPASAARLYGGEEGVRRMIADFLEKTPAISSSEFKVTREGDRLHVRVRAGFDSALDLREVTEGPSIRALPSAASHLTGNIDVEFRGRTVDFSRTISPARALPGAMFMPNSQFEGHRLVYTMHLPAAARSSNATRVENAGHTLVWDVPLAAAVRTPIVTSFQMDVPIPWKLVSGVAIPLTLGLGALVVLRLRKARASVDG